MFHIQIKPITDHTLNHRAFKQSAYQSYDDKSERSHPINCPTIQPIQITKHSLNKAKQIDHEIFSTVILSLPLIQEGQLSVSGERMCTILVNRLED